MSHSLTAARSGLSSTALKGIALVLMVLDHIHYFFEFTGVIPLWFSLAGRLSAPLFLFCTVEGFAHTQDRRRYFCVSGASLPEWAFCSFDDVRGSVGTARRIFPHERHLYELCHPDPRMAGH